VYFYELRRAYFALGARLVKDSVLSDQEIIFFAGKHEIYAYLDGDLSSERLRRRVEWRRSWWLRVKDEDPPSFLKGNLPFEPESEIERSGTDVVGMGGAPGIARGPVRLVRSLDQLGLIQQGDIVVTHAIDPAWTPVFGLIGGVISEEGGILSHATVLGREYGLPVIIGVARAASILNDGDTVEINGTTGAVRLLDPGSKS
jgi:pyruvate,water dikinase